MKKIIKGEPGYLDYKKRVEILRTVIYFALVAAVFFLGLSQAHTRNNLLTIVAVLGCLPSAKALVGVIMRLPHPSVSQEEALKFKSVTENLTTACDLIVTSREKIMPIEFILIKGDIVLGYASSKKVDPDYAKEYIHSMLAQNGQGKAAVKILHDFAAFLARAKELNALAARESGTSAARESGTIAARESGTSAARERNRNQEEQIKGVILNISL